MYPELFTIGNLTIHSYGLMIALGVLISAAALYREAPREDINPDHILEAVIASVFFGLIGARLLYVFLNWSYFRANPGEILFAQFAGLSFFGGLFLGVFILYIWSSWRKIGFLKLADLMAPYLLLGYAFARVGCFLNGCCYGKPADVPWAVQFPYASLPYYSQIYPDEQRSRHEPRLDLPSAYFGWLDQEGNWIEASPENKHYAGLKPKAMLTPEQKTAVTEGPYRALPVHPTQIYASLNAFILAGAFYGLWRIIGLKRPGMVLGLVMIAYGVTRFGLEAMRDDNPFEYAWWMLYQGGTISQNLSIYLILTGAILLGVISKMKPCASADPHPGKAAKKR